MSQNSYYFCHDKETIDSIFSKIRYGSSMQVDGLEKKLEYPKEIGGVMVSGIRDLTVGYDSSTHDTKPLLPTSASSQMITFSFENNAVISIRNSGTEPKLKYYSEIRGDNATQAETDLKGLVKEFCRVLL